MIFYGVYIKNKELAFLFDAVRFLAQPDALRRSHITVRGPYERRINIDRINQAGLGDLGIIRPGNFFFNRQKTVFLYCDIVGIRDIWNKPDFQDGIVHLTLYDGKDDTEARKFFELISLYRWNIWTRPTELMEIEKKTINTEAINILEPSFTREFMDTFGMTFDVSGVRKLSFSDRFKMITFLLDRIRNRFMINPPKI